MNTPERIFLGWDEPAIKLVANRLYQALINKKTAPLYRRATVVVPTAESGRRLRERLAEMSTEEQKQIPLLLPKITLAGHLIPANGANVASEEETLAAWLQVLGGSEADPVAQYVPLIPRRPETHRERWAVGAAHKLMSLRNRLEQENITYDRVTHLLRSHEVALQEKLNSHTQLPDRQRRTLLARQEVLKNEQIRWQKLGELFAQVDATICRNSKNTDIIPREKAIAAEIRNPQKIRRGTLVIIACLPELSPQLENYLLNLISLRDCEVQVWMNIPEEEASHFDCMGRPKESDWAERDIDIPHAEAPSNSAPLQPTIHLSNSADELAKTARELAGGFNSDEVVLVTGDSSYTPALINSFADPKNGWELKSPEGRSLQTTDIGLLPDQLADYCSARQDFFSNATQNAGMLELNAFVALLNNRALQHVLDASPTVQAGLQRHVEKLRDALLPASVERLCHFLNPETLLPAKDYRELEYLAAERCTEFYEFTLTAATFAEACCAPASLPGQLRILQAKLLATYAEEPLRTAVYSLDKIIQSLLSKSFSTRIQAPAFLLELLRYKARNEASALKPAESSPLQAGDVLGWRELTFAPGHRVIISAMHDGCIPEPVPEDEFLPESLCLELGIKHEAFRSARDTFLLTALLHSRKPGDVHFLLSRQNPDGTPVAPSPLLLRCGNNLPERARKLFAEPSVVSAQPVIPLCPLRAAKNGPEINKLIEPGMMENITQLAPPVSNPFANQSRTYSPSSLSGFLQCPLSFWLKHLFGLDAGNTYDEEKSELESNEYGTLMHAVLQHVVEAVPHIEKLKAMFPESADAKSLAAALTQFARETAIAEWRKVYMTDIERGVQPLPLEIQLRNIEKTLQDFAWRHVMDLQAGWRNICCEKRLKPTLTLVSGELARFSMIADRIDYNPDRNRWRIIDYKTSSTDKKPLKVHFDEVKNGKESPFFRFMNTGEYQFPLVTARFGSKGDNYKYYRWKDVQLMLYAFGIRQLTAKDLNNELPAESLADIMPDLYYYNLQSKTQRMECYPLIEEGKLCAIPGRGKQIGHFCHRPDELLENALQTIDSAIRMIEAGQCLFSAEALQYKSRPFTRLAESTNDKNAPRFGAISQQCDPRSMFNLPQLHI